MGGNKFEKIIELASDISSTFGQSFNFIKLPLIYADDVAATSDALECNEKTTK